MRTDIIYTNNLRYEVGATFPNAYTYSHTPFSHVSLEERSGAITGDASLRLYTLQESGDVEDEVVLTRSFRRKDGASVIVFPISDVLDHLAGEMFVSPKIYISIYVDDEWFALSSITSAIVGVSDTELVDFQTQIAEGATFQKPRFYPLIPLYPSGPEGCITEIPTPEGQPNAKVVLSFGTTLPSSFNAVTSITHSQVKPSASVGDRGNIRIQYAYSSTGLYFDIPAVLDDCSEGLFVRWRDKSGLRQVYRWDVERVVESFEEENSYRELVDSNTRLEDRLSVVMKATKSYTLHSRMLEKSVSELPKSMLTGRSLEYYDKELSRWIPCRVSDTEVEDDLAPMLNIVVELVSDIKTMPW